MLTPVKDKSSPPFGKHFSSMYTGSMIGSGALAYALMGYVIANQIPVGPPGEQWMEVELNPKLLAFVIGEKESEVEEVIGWLCQPDPKSRTKKEDGRRLVRKGEYRYRVVNGFYYRDLRDNERRREQNREAKKRERGRKKASNALPGELEYDRAEKSGESQESLDKRVENHLPK